jgi:hypothetical protein
MRGGYDFDSVRFFVSLLTQLINITVNQILTQEWFLLQDIKDSSYFRNSVEPKKSLGTKLQRLLIPVVEKPDTAFWTVADLPQACLNKDPNAKREIFLLS